MDIIAPIVSIVIIVLICTCCGMACKRKREGAIFSTPVVVVSEQHTSAGPYPVTVQHHPGAANMTAAPQAYPMPQPMPGQYGQYPAPGQAPYPTNAPYPTTNAPYPAMGMPQPGVGVMPMGQNPANMNPPSYNEVVGNEGYQKQAPYNPNFSS